MVKSQQFYWFKYRECLSSGKLDWQYVELAMTRISDVESYLMEHGNLTTWSEHWRKLEVKRVKVPPEDVVKSRLESVKGKIGFLQREYKRLNRLLKVMR